MSVFDEYEASSKNERPVPSPKSVFDEFEQASKSKSVFDQFEKLNTVPSHHPASLDFKGTPVAPGMPTKLEEVSPQGFDPADVAKSPVYIAEGALSTVSGMAAFATSQLGARAYELGLRIQGDKDAYEKAKEFGDFLASHYSYVPMTKGGQQASKLMNLPIESAELAAEEGMKAAGVPENLRKEILDRAMTVALAYGAAKGAASKGEAPKRPITAEEAAGMPKMKKSESLQRQFRDWHEKIGEEIKSLEQSPLKRDKERAEFMRNDRGIRSEGWKKSIREAAKEEEIAGYRSKEGSFEDLMDKEIPKKEDSASKESKILPQEETVGVPINDKRSALRAFYEDDLKETVLNTGKSVYEIASGAWKVVDPKAGVPRDVLDIVKRKIGDRNYAEFVVGVAVNDAKKSVSRLPRNEQIAFIDRIKRGEKQPTPEMQQLADLFRQIDDSMARERESVRPDAAYLENHARVIWEKIPGAEPERSGLAGIFGKRRLKGSMGGWRQHKLADMSEGIAKGGVPKSYNAFELLEMAYADTMKYVTTKRMMDGLKAGGFAEFVPSTGRPKEGFKIPQDSSFTVFDDKGKIAGHWAIEENAARIIDNYTGPDKIRETLTGRGLMALKNHYTGLELGLSPFHLVAMTQEAWVSKIGVAGRLIWNEVIGKGNVEALKELPGVFTYRPAITGGRLKKFAEGLAKAKMNGTAEAYLKNPWVQEFLEKVPDAEQYIQDLFDGGIRDFGMHSDFKVHAVKSFQEAVANDNYVGAALRSIPAANQIIMTPLFDIYIPRLKVGVFLQEFPLRLREQARNLSSGKKTRAQIARETWDFVEDRFGEVNFDNLFWNRSFKSLAQIVMRSPSWFYGSVRAFGKAGRNQTVEFYNALKEKRTPQLTPEGAWSVALVLHTYLAAKMIQYAFTGDAEIRDWRDVAGPRVDPNDDKKRITLPTYFKEPVHFLHDPKTYIAGKLSGDVGKAVDLARNRDYFGTEIYSKKDPMYKIARDIGAYSFPLPISVQQYDKAKEEEDSAVLRAMHFSGFPRAASYLSKSPAEKLMDEYAGEGGEGKTRTKQQASEHKEVRRLRNLFRKDPKQGLKEADEAVASKKISKAQADRVIADYNLTPLQARFKAIRSPDSLAETTFSRAVNVFEKMSEKEKEEVADQMFDKLTTYLKKSPEGKDPELERFLKIINALPTKERNAWNSALEGM